VDLEVAGSDLLLVEKTREKCPSDQRAPIPMPLTTVWNIISECSDPLECPDDESREVLKPLSSGDTISLTDTQLPAEDIPDVRITRDNLSSGTARMQKDDPHTGEIVGKKRDNGESELLGQQSTFDKSMPGTTLNEEVVCLDQMIEPDLLSSRA
jgi:hypothetical protein